MLLTLSSRHPNGYNDEVDATVECLARDGRRCVASRFHTNLLHHVPVGDAPGADREPGANRHGP